MANMCANYLKLTKGLKKAFLSEIQNLAKLEQETDKGQKPFGIGDEYLFDIDVQEAEKSFSFTTRWNHNAEQMAQIAKRAKVQFFMASEEFSADLFAEFKFDGKTLFERALSSEILNEIEIVDDGCIYRGKEYDSREELCERLIKKVKFQAVKV